MNAPLLAATREDAARVYHVEQAPRDFLAGVRVALCDWSTALERAGAAGLPADARIRTSAPALARRGGRIEALEAKLPPGRLQAIHDDTFDLSLDLFRALEAEPKVREFALGVAVHGLRTQRVLAKAACLSEDDYAQPRAVLSVATGSEFLDWKFNAPWESLLKSNPDLRILRVPYQPEKEQELTRLIDRVRLSWESRVYRLLLAIGSRWPRWLARGSAYVLSENELQREAAVSLGLRGFRLLPLPKVEAKPSLPDATAQTIADVVRSVALRRYRAFACPSAAEAVCDVLLRAALQDAAVESAAFAAWREAGEKVFRPGDFVLAGFPKGAMSRGLWRACESKGVTFCSFQHGVTREIASANRAMRVGHEGNSSHLFFAFNRRAVEVAQTNPFSRGRAIAVGLPDEYSRTGSFRRRRRDAPPVFYVSTNLYFANGNLPQGDLSDTGRAELEIAVIDRMLARLPYRVLYKTYPDQRYLDVDPVVERAQQAPNIELFEAPLNLRYLLPDCRVIVTSRATSTTSWCLLSGKPMVFIDWPQQSPLLPDARAALADAIFLFDGARPDVLEEAAEFLSQPLERIEALYAEKAAARKAAIEEFFSTGGRGAGRRAARAILSARRERL